MRTAVTLEPDVAALLKQVVRERGVPFKQALNEALRAGLAIPGPAVEPFRQRSFRPGHTRAGLTKALVMAGELDDQRALARQRQ